ncbi:MAG: ATPase, T2SS/T4P/T4SS family [Kiritimatiellia bacterium]
MPNTILEIHRPNREPASFELEPGIYSIGSDSDCKICLPGDSVEFRHAILTIRKDAIWLENLSSESGTHLDGAAITGRCPIHDGQKIDLGIYALIVNPATKPAMPDVPAPAPIEIPDAQDIPLPTTATFTPETGTANTDLDQKRSIKQQIHKELVSRMNIKRMSLSGINEKELAAKAQATIDGIMQDIRDKLPFGINAAELAREIFDEALRLGPLEIFLADDEVTEIMVNGPNQIYIEKKGKLTLSNQTFMDDSSVMAIIERIVSPLGRRIDESQPYVDARLADGSRVNAIIHPLSLVGPCLTIRKFSKTPFTDQDLINFGTITPQTAEFIRTCVILRKNIIVSGGTGSGKTSLLNVISSYIPQQDRILTIEDAAELKLKQDHVVSLEARPPNIEGKGAVTIRDLVRNALRMRPDRIVVGECRGGEALDMLQAMNTGHDGSLTTVHANAPRDVISRLETMVLMSGMELPVRAIREQIASAVDIIVHESRFSDGTRKVTNVTEIVGQEGEQITMQDIFAFKQTGVDENGKVTGALNATGSVPTFLEEISARGLHIDHTIFTPPARL